MSRIIKKGATSQSLYFDVFDSTSTTGGRKTGLVYNTSNLIAYYVRNGGSATAITLATLAAANSSWSSGGFKEVDATNMPGLYRLDVPDAAFATGAESVVVSILGASGMVMSSEIVQLVDNLASDVYSRLGAPAGASVSADIATVAGYVDTEVAAIKAKTDQLTFTVSNQVDVNVVDWKGSAAPAMTGDAYARIGAPAGASVSADIAAVKSDSGAIKANTDNLPSDPADQSLIIAATDSLSGQISGLNNLSQADIRNAVGLASANLDTQIAALATAAGLSDLSDGISASFTGLQGHGDSAWATATGFSTYDGSDTAGTTTLLSRLTATRAGNLDNLDAAVTSRLAAADYTAPDDTAVLAAIAGLNDLSAADVNAEVDTALADAGVTTVRMGHLDVDVSTRASQTSVDGLAIPAASDNADAILAAAYEGSETVQDHLRLARAALYGKANGLAGSTVHFRDAADSKNRLTATVDADGNRAAVTTDAT